MKSRYEYRSIVVDWPRFQATLNEQGAEGWRLVNTHIERGGEDLIGHKIDPRYWVIMEREI
jgi:hypothetical protein